MAKRKTMLLALLVLCGVFAAAATYFRMSELRESAATAQAHLIEGERTIKEIRDWKASPGRAAAVSADTPELTKHLRQAASAAGLADAPGIETDTPKPIGNSDYSEMALDLRFEPLTLRQLTTFLHTLAQIDPNSRATQIELSPPDQVTPAGGKGAGEELWRADVAVGYLTYTPRKAGR